MALTMSLRRAKSRSQSKRGRKRKRKAVHANRGNQQSTKTPTMTTKMIKTGVERTGIGMLRMTVRVPILDPRCIVGPGGERAVLTKGARLAAGAKDSVSRR